MTISYEVVLFLFCWSLGSTFFAATMLALSKGLLSSGYAVLWFFVASLCFSLPLLPQVLTWVGKGLGFISPSSMLFLLGILACLGILLLMSIHISKLRREVSKLTQVLAISLPESVKTEAVDRL